MTDAEGRIELELAAEPAAVGRIRSVVRDFAASVGAPAALLADLALAVSEAATNALMHAYVDRSPGRIRLVARAGVDELVVNVIDDGRGMQPRPDSPGMGIGLPTIGQLASGLDIRDRPGGGTDVRMTFAAPGVRAAHAPAPPEEEHTRLLAEVARLAEGGGWPAEGVEALVDLLVPDVADACAVDTAGDGSPPRRLAARVAGDAELSRLLAARPPAPLEGSIRVIDLTAAALEPSDVELVGRAQLAWWVIVPLREGNAIHGALQLGMRAERGHPGEEDLAFFALLAERATAGLATARLMEELRRTRQRLERILGSLAEAVTVHDAAGQTVYANEAAARLLGARSAEEVLAARPGDVAARFRMTREDGSPVGVDDLPGRRLVRGRDAEPLLTRSVNLDTGEERWLLTKATLLDDEGPLAVNVIEDVTEAKNAERRQRFLAQASDLLVGAPPTEIALQRLAELLVVDLADWCVIDLAAGDGSLRRVAMAHTDPERVRTAREMEARYPRPRDPGPAMRALLDDGEPLLVPALTDEMLRSTARDAEHLRMLREVGLRSVILVPLRGGERTLGVVTLLSADSGRAFDEADLAFAVDVGRRAGAAVDAALRRGPLIDRLAALGVSDLLETVVHHLPIGVVVAEAPSGRLLVGNEQLERILRHPFLEAAAVGEYDRYRGFHPDGRPLAADEWPLARSIAHGEVVRDELIDIERGDGSDGTISVDSLPIRAADGTIVAGVAVFTDVTERERSAGAVALLAETGSLLAEPMAIDERLRRVASLCVPALADLCVVYLLRPDGSAVRHFAAADPEVERMMADALPLDVSGDVPVARVIRSGEPELLWDVPEETLRASARDAAHAEAMARLVPMSSLVLPLRGRSGVLGALGAFTVGRRRRFGDVELQVGIEVGRRCALALENADLYLRQRTLADALQAGLLPSALPAVPGTEIAASYVPAGGDAVVGGDFYDVFETPAGWAFAIGDVCGKGPAAATLTGLARAAIRVGALVDPSPARVLALLNDALLHGAEDRELRLCTAIAGLAVPSDGALAIELATGGHPPPLVLGRGAPAPVDVRGRMLGVDRDPELGTVSLTLARGETLLLFTDGVLDSAAGEGRLGEAGLERLLGGLPTAPAALVPGLEERLADGGRAARRDDVAMLALGPS